MELENGNYNNVKKAYVSGGEIQDFDSNCMTLAKQFDKNLKYNGKEGIYFYNIDGNVEFNSYYDIKGHAMRILNGMKKANIKPKDMLIFQCSNPKDFVDIFWACMYGGVVPLLANLPKSLEDITATDSLTVYNIWKMIGDAKILVSGDVVEEYMDFAEKIGIDTSYLINIECLRDNDETDEIFESNPEEMAMMFFTSGSTGLPKGVVQTNRAAVMREYGQIQLNKTKKDILLNWMPLEHAAGVLMTHLRGVMKGSTQIQVDTRYIIAEPLRWLDLMDKYRVNYSWAPHFAFVLINEAVESYSGEWDLSCIEYLLDAGEMVHAKSGKIFLSLLKKYGLKSNVIYPTWGMCETCSVTMYNLDFDDNEFSGLQLVAKDTSKGVIAQTADEADFITEIGIPIPGCEIRISNQNNETLPEDTIGKFLIKGEPVTKGYYKNEEVNQESYTEDGWFITGDLGFIHDGKMVITGREKDIIIINGLNYNNVEIEAVIEENPNIEKSYTAVCSVRNPETQGDIIIAFIVPKGNCDRKALTNEIKRHVFEKIKLNITHVIPVAKNDILKTNLGKIQRAKLGKKFTDGEFLAFMDGNEQVGEKIIEAEQLIKNKMEISDVALLLEEQKNDLDYIPVSSLGVDSERKLYEQIESNLWDDIITELSGVEGVSSIIMGIDGTLPIIFFEACLKNFDFNVLTLKSLHECMEVKFGFSNILVIPISCIEIKSDKINDLLEAYRNGYFNLLLERIDISLKNENTVPGWFYEDRIIEAPISENELNIDDSFTFIICNNIDLIKEYECYNAEKLNNLLFIMDCSCKGTALSINAKIEYVNIYDKSDYSKIIEKWSEGKERINIVHLAGCDKYCIDGLKSLKEAQYKTVVSVQNIIQSFDKIKTILNSAIIFTLDALCLDNNDNNNYAVSTVSGYVKAAADEGFAVKHIDLDSKSMISIMDIIKKEKAIHDYSQILYRNNERFKVGLEKVDILENKNNIPLVKSGFYVITGGLGGIGIKITEVLLERYQANVLLIGRSELVEGSEKDTAFNQLKLKEKGANRVIYEPCNIIEENQVDKLISQYEKEFGHKLSGVIHLAGEIMEELIVDQDEIGLLGIYEAKVFGSYTLSRIFANRSKAIFVTTSSARTLIPGITVSAYCSASEFNVNLCGYLTHSFGIETYCISWSQWNETGMSKGLIVRDLLEQKGLKVIPEIWGKYSFMVALKSGKYNLYVGLDETKNSISSIIKQKSKDSSQTIEIFTNYQNAVHKEETFIACVTNVLNGFEEFKKMDKEIHFLHHLPFNKNGLVDKNLLKNRKRFLLGEIKNISPRNLFEQKVYDCWTDVFKTIEFGVTDKFFELGGDSIKALRLISLLKAQFNTVVKNQDIFKLSTVEQQALYFENICPNLDKEKKIIKADETPKDKEEIEYVLMLSDAQYRQGILYEMDPEYPYNMNTIEILIEGNVILPCIKMALQQVIERHDILRSRYRSINGEYSQIILDISSDFNISEVDLTLVDESEKNAKLEEYYKEEINKVIYIDKEFPIRASIIKFSADKYILLLSVHHFVADRSSMRVLFKEICTIYSDILAYGHSKLPELPVKFAEYVKHHQSFRGNKKFQKEIINLKNVITGIQSLKLPINEGGNILTEKLLFEIDKSVASTFPVACKEKNGTITVLLIGIFSYVICKILNKKEFIFETLDIDDCKHENEIGFFENILPVKMNLDADSTLDSLFNQADQKILAMYENKDMFLENLSDELGTRTKIDKNSLVHILLVFENEITVVQKTTDIKWKFRFLNDDISKFDIVISVSEIDEKFSILFKYNSNTFSSEKIHDMQEEYSKLVKKISDYPKDII